MIVAFDIDGTLRDQCDRPRYEVINLLLSFRALGCTIYVWSGGGIDYARHVVERLGIDQMVEVVGKGSFVPDLAVDDETVALGLTNLKVPACQS